MRVANLDGRLVIVTGEAGHEIGYDVEKSSGGQFSSDPQAVYDVWGAFTTWAAAGQFTDGTPVAADALGSPAPARARDVLKRGDQRTFRLVTVDSERRIAELALS